MRFTHRVLHAALERARKWKLIAESPVRDATAPSLRKSPVKALTAEQVGHLLAAAALNAETHCITALFLTCGIRRSELLGLALDAVDLDAGKIEIKRTVVEVRESIDTGTGEVTKKARDDVREVMKSDSSAREITPPAPMVELLREQKARVLAMALKWGRDISAIRCSCSPASRAHRCSRRTYCTACDRSYAARRSSALRRAMRGGTSATQLLDGGQNIKTVQTRLGHASPATTLALYVHPVEKRDREAADLLGALLKP